MFNAVAAGGFGVQLACLVGLTEMAGMHYLLSAVFAVEAAILHNFFWHLRWTWADRSCPGRSWQQLLVRFNLIHGATAAAGLLLIVGLSEVARLHYLAAAIVSIGVCSVVNFIASDAAVFVRCPRARRAAHETSQWDGARGRHVCAAAVVLTAGVSLVAAGPTEHALAEFERRAALIERRLAEERRGERPFFRIDELAPSDRDVAYRKLLKGLVLIEPVARMDAGGPAPCGPALCHHWIATVLAPRATLQDTVALMQSYDDYSTIYEPAVRRSRLLSRDGDHFSVLLQLFTRNVLTVVLNTEYDVWYARVGSNRMQVRSLSSRIAEVDQPGTPAEREVAVGHDRGFLWRLNTYCAVEERREGTYLQCESLSLTRSIPTGLGWIVKPFVTSVPRESLEFTLGTIRKRLSSAALTSPQLPAR
jgi:putative flippase GtrA